MLVEIPAGRAVDLDRPRRGDVIGGDRIAEDSQRPRGDARSSPYLICRIAADPDSSAEWFRAAQFHEPARGPAIEQQFLFETATAFLVESFRN